MDIEAIIASAQLPQKSEALCLRGDLQVAWETLDRQLKAVRSEDSDTLAGPDTKKVRAIAEQMAAIEEEMRAHTHTFTFQALGGPAYTDLLAAHKPTEEQKAKGDDVNWDTVGVALAAACAIDPVMTEEQAGRLADTITQGQWNRILATVLGLNRKEVDVPFSPTASAILRGSGSKSKPPAPGASADAAISAGSLAR